ncbi:hypothetical protein P3T76_015193 [Phytophthora citrophthora]|uniref:Uncharacterized protein n=1 Tax=Phytophthora citrophthora TaxID=4793 RepID=A0AAD9LAG5_9STRA|nr:hypothetical protein P3T76_015193 [Phytophthora citrophthora]
MAAPSVIMKGVRKELYRLEGATITVEGWNVSIQGAIKRRIYEDCALRMEDRTSAHRTDVTSEISLRGYVTSTVERYVVQKLDARRIQRLTAKARSIGAFEAVRFSSASFYSV